MTAYNQVNGVTMTEHHELVNEVLRGEWGFDGFNVSDWMAARSTAGALRGGLDVAMPGPATVYGEAPRRRRPRRGGGGVRRRRGRTHRPAARRPRRRPRRRPAGRHGTPAPIDGDALARELAHRGFVLVRNAVRRPAGTPYGSLWRTLYGSPWRTPYGGPRGPCTEARGGPRTGVRRGSRTDRRPRPPLAPGTTVALSGGAARDARVLGGGSAQVFPDHVVSPLDGLAAALPEGALTYAVGADPSDEPAPAGPGFALRARCRDAAGKLLGEGSLPGGQVQWIGDDLPEGVTHEALASVEVVGTFTPRETGEHSFGTRGLGAFVLTVAGETVFDGVQAMGSESDPFEAFFGSPVERARVPLTAGETVEVSLLHTLDEEFAAPLPVVAFSLVHLGPRRDPDELIAEAVAEARAADTAVVVVATTERVESEGFDRTDLALPGRQDDLVRAVAAANPNTVVVVNAGSPVEMPWREDVAAVLLTWFPGQEGGAALADVLTGAEEPGGRLPTTWPAVLADAPVTDVVPVDGELAYAEGPFIGYRAWDRSGRTPRVRLRPRPRLHHLVVRLPGRGPRHGHRPDHQHRRPAGPRDRPGLSGARALLGRRRAPGPRPRRLRERRGGPRGDRRDRDRALPPGLRGLGRGGGRLDVRSRGIRGQGRTLPRRRAPDGRAGDRLTLRRGPRDGSGRDLTPAPGPLTRP